MTREETGKVNELAKYVCNILKIAYPMFNIDFTYYEIEGVLTFNIDKRKYNVYVAGDSITACVVDIAEQLLTKYIHNHY